MPCGFPPQPSGWQKAWYLFLVIVMSIAYFFYAIFVGIYGWITSGFKDDS